MPESYPRRTLSPDAPASPGSDVLGDVAIRPATTLPASRVPSPHADLDTPRAGAFACPLCGSVPSPLLMPSRAPGWLWPRLRLRLARLRALRAAEARLTFQHWGWA